MSIGLIGLGNMGWPLALRLADEDQASLVFDASPAVLERAVAPNVSAASSLDEVVRRCGTVLLSLPTPEASRTVASEIVKLAPKRRIIVDFGTNDPQTARALHAAAAEQGSAYVDAPVSGGPSRARTGELSVMVGGDEEAVREVWPILGLVGKQVQHVGPSGAGTIAKLLNNFVAIWGMIGISQAFLAADLLGVSHQRIHDVLAKSSGRSYSLDRNAPKIIERNYKPDFSLELAEKDMRLALQLIESAGLKPFAAADIRWLFETSAKTRGDRDLAAIYETLEAAARGEA